MEFNEAEVLSPCCKAYMEFSDCIRVDGDGPALIPANINDGVAQLEDSYNCEDCGKLYAVDSFVETKVTTEWKSLREVK